MSAAATTELTAVARGPSLPTFFDNLDSFAETPEGMAKLRALILDLAVRGKLVEQDENDEPAPESVEKIERIKSRLLDEKKIQKDKKFAPTVSSDPPWEIHDSWSWVRLQDAFEVVRGGSPRPAGDPRYFGGDIPWITVREITKDDGKFLTETRYCITELGSEKSRFVHADDLLLTNSGATLGVPKINKITGCINDGVAFLNCFHDFIDKEFAYYFLTQQTPAFRAVNQGMGQPNLNTPILAGWFFPLPPLSEQRRIVSKVDGLMSLCDELESRGSARVRLRERASRSCLDRLVNATRKPMGRRGSRRTGIGKTRPAAIGSAGASPSQTNESLSNAWQRLADHFEVLYDTPETLAHLRQSILQLAVQGKLVPQDPNDEPASAALARIRGRTNDLIAAGELKKPKTVLPLELKSNEETVPDSWEWVQLCDILRYGPRNGYSPKPVDYETPVKSLTLCATTSGTFDGKYVKFIDEDVADDSYLWLRDGDILIQRSNSLDYVGVTAIYSGPSHEFIYPDLMMKFRVDDEIELDFMQLVLRSLQSRTFFQTRATGTSGSMRKINQSIVVSLPIPLPPLAEQKRLVAKVDQLLSQCDELSARLRERQSSTQQLLTATIHQILTSSAV